MFRLFGLAVCDVAAGTLAWSGCMKLFDPRAFATSATVARIARRPGSARLLARSVGLVEVVLALLALFVGSAWTIALLGGAYAVFAGISARAVTVDAPSCGCFGQRSVRPTWTHVGIDAIVAAVAIAAAATVVGTASVVDRLDPSAPIAATYLVFAVMGSVLLVGALTRAERPVPVVIARPAARR